MDPAVKATRTAIARNRVTVAAEALAARHGLGAQMDAISAAMRAPISARDVLQMEAVADLIDAIVGSGSEPAQDASPVSELAMLESVGPKLAETLAEHGITNVVMLRETSDGELLAIDGIGAGKLRRIRADVGSPVEPMDDAEAEPSGEAEA